MFWIRLCSESISIYNIVFRPVTLELTGKKRADQLEAGTRREGAEELDVILPP